MICIDLAKGYMYFMAIEAKQIIIEIKQKLQVIVSGFLN